MNCQNCEQYSTYNYLHPSRFRDFSTHVGGLCIRARCTMNGLSYRCNSLDARSCSQLIDHWRYQPTRWGWGILDHPHEPLCIAISTYTTCWLIGPTVTGLFNKHWTIWGSSVHSISGYHSGSWHACQFINSHVGTHVPEDVSKEW